MVEPKTIKVCLENEGADSETPWAHDLGPAPGPKGSRKVRLVNVPFMHAKPTWGDIIIVSPVEDGFPTWDRDGIPFSRIGSRIHEDGGRWAMILDYRNDRGTTADAAFKALGRACAELDMVCEGAWGPDTNRSGRVYLAVKNGTSDTAVMNHLERADLPCTLAQIHPTPRKPKAKAKGTVKARPRAPARKPAAKRKQSR